MPLRMVKLRLKKKKRKKKRRERKKSHEKKKTFICVEKFHAIDIESKPNPQHTLTPDSDSALNVTNNSSSWWELFFFDTTHILKKQINKDCWEKPPKQLNMYG